MMLPDVPNTSMVPRSITPLSILGILAAILFVALLHGQHGSALSDRFLQQRKPSDRVRTTANAAGVGSLAYTIVVTQVPIGQLPDDPPSEGALQSCPCEQGRIVAYSPGIKPLVLSKGFHSAGDPEVSFDGQRILFAGKKTSTDNWDIYEIGADSSGLRRVTTGIGNCRNPVYLSTLYTLISEKPWHQIAFTSDGARTTGEYGTHLVTSIYSCRLDGSGFLRITHGPSGETDPFLMNDGRLLFTGLRRRSLDGPARSPLFAVNIDGTDCELFCDAGGQRYKRMPLVTSDGSVIFVESERLRRDGAGTLACVSLRRNLHSYRRITQPADGLFRSPSPTPDGRVLVSKRIADGARTFGIYLFDPESGTARPVLDDPNFDELQANCLAPRSEPDGRSTSVLRRTGEIEDPFALESNQSSSRPSAAPSGRLYCLNAYNSSLLKPEWLPPGTIKRVRVLEGMPSFSPTHRADDRAGSMAEPSGARPLAAPTLPILKRRFLGEVPVEDDGSFNIHVPANVPIELQILDADGIALESCAWIWVKNNEPRGCIGCHEDPELVPENRLVKAVAQPSVELMLPAARRRSVDFLHDVMPIVQSKCVSCHKAGSMLPNFDYEKDESVADSDPKEAYATLLLGTEKGNAQYQWDGKYVTPGRARTSPLIWHIFGRDTSRPWDRLHQASRLRLMPVSEKGALTENEKRTFIESIDTGAHWDNRPSESSAREQESARERVQR